MTSSLEWVFVAGVVWFALASVASFVYGAVLNSRNRTNPGTLVAVVSLAFAVFYALQLVAWGIWLRNGDGREVPWTRGAVIILAYAVYSWSLVVALWADWNDAWMVVVGQVITGACILGADLTAVNLCWYWWSMGVATYVLSMVWALRRARTNTWVAWLLWGGWWIFGVGTLVVQALSWTMGQRLDTAPSRLNSEIAYLVVSAVGLTLYGLVCMSFFSERPKFTQESTRVSPTLIPVTPTMPHAKSS